MKKTKTFIPYIKLSSCYATYIKQCVSFFHLTVYSGEENKGFYVKSIGLTRGHPTVKFWPAIETANFTVNFTTWLMLIHFTSMTAVSVYLEAAICYKSNFNRFFFY